MKIAIYTPVFFPNKVGGAERQAKLLASFLLKNGIKVIILTPNDGNLPEKENIEGLDVIRFKTPLSQFKKARKNNDYNATKLVCFDYSSKSGEDLYYEKYDFDLKSIIHSIDLFLGLFFTFFKLKNDIDLIQINTVTYQAYLLSIVSKLINKKLIVKDSTMDGVEKMHGCLFPKLAKSILINNTHFVAMTNAIKYNMILNGIKENRIALIPNGIIINSVKPSLKIRNYKCLFVGNLSQQPAKGIDILLLAWENVINRFPNAELTIIGSGEIEQYKQYILKFNYSNSISFLGHQNPLEYYQSHEIFILPSRREGLSNALLEAINFGLKVIATDISGNQDLIINDSYGKLVIPNSVESLSAGIIEVMESENAEYSNLAFDHLKTNYSIENVAFKYISLYKELI